MAHLEIMHLTGDVEKRPLHKQQPVTIGSHDSNDVRLEEDGVELIHCRISWNKSGYEAVAAGVDPIDVNGNLVRRASLSSGDVLRVGTVDLTFKTGDEPPAELPTGPVGLKPLTDELPTFFSEPPQVKTPPAVKPKPAAAPSPPKKSARPAPVKSEPAARIDEILADDDETSSGESGAGGDDWSKNLAALAAESRVEEKTARGGSRKGDRAAEPVDEVIEELEETEDASTPAATPEAGKVAAVSDRLRQAMHHRRERPGEEDTLRSPLVLGFAGLAATLLLLAAVLYFIGNRRSTQEQFDAAKALVDEGKYAQAIKQLEEFADTHLGHPLEQPARMMAGIAEVDRHLSGAIKDWPKGLEELKRFINDYRDYEGFELQHDLLWRRAGDISLGSAETAAKAFSRDLLQVSKDAEAILNTYAPKDSPPTQLLQQIAATRRSSEAVILRHETFATATAELNAALESSDPMVALEKRRDLLIRYPDFRTDAKLAELLTKTLDTERGLVEAEQLDRAALTDDPDASSAPGLSLIFNARSRTDSVSVGQAVSVLAKDCCYGVDTVTGQPVWRRVIGLNTPFFPLREPSVPSLILFDTRRQELARVHADTGALIWRQPIDEPVSGQPLLDEGQIYLPTRGGGLYKIDLQSGSVSTRLQFSQEVTGAVPLGDG